LWSESGNVEDAVPWMTNARLFLLNAKVLGNIQHVHIHSKNIFK